VHYVAWARTGHPRSPPRYRLLRNQTKEPKRPLAQTRKGTPLTGVPHNRVYHGIGAASGRLWVEPPAEGPTERADIKPIRELLPPSDGSFGWGYNGGGPSRAAAAILADAFEAGPETFWPGLHDDTTNLDMREAFCEDILTYVCDEFRISRYAVLTWANGWRATYQPE
jgi:hypothetical protein